MCGVTASIAVTAGLNEAEGGRGSACGGNMDGELAGVEPKRRRGQVEVRRGRNISLIFECRMVQAILFWRVLAPRPAWANEYLKLELSWLGQPTNSS